MPITDFYVNHGRINPRAPLAAVPAAAAAAPSALPARCHRRAEACAQLQWLFSRFESSDKRYECGSRQPVTRVIYLHARRFVETIRLHVHDLARISIDTP